MKAFGLTGNIGCGKSTVASLLSKYADLVILDCDLIAKEIINDRNHRQEINTILCTEVFKGETADFKLIAKIIFGDSLKKESLEKLIHPLVWKIVKEKVEETGNQKISIVESAIIYETKSQSKFSGIIVATCNLTEQFRRLRQNRNMEETQIKARLGEQLPSDRKEALAQFIVKTDCNLDELESRVSKLYSHLRQEKERVS